MSHCGQVTETFYILPQIEIEHLGFYFGLVSVTEQIQMNQKTIISLMHFRLQVMSGLPYQSLLIASSLILLGLLVFVHFYSVDEDGKTVIMPEHWLHVICGCVFLDIVLIILVV